MIRAIEIVVSVLSVFAAGIFVVTRKQQSRAYATWMSADEGLKQAREEFESSRRWCYWLFALEVVCYLAGFAVTRFTSPHTAIDIGCLAAVSIGWLCTVMAAHHYGMDDTETELGQRAHRRSL